MNVHTVCLESHGEEEGVWRLDGVIVVLTFVVRVVGAGQRGGRVRGRGRLIVESWGNAFREGHAAHRHRLLADGACIALTEPRNDAVAVEHVATG